MHNHFISIATNLRLSALALIMVCGFTASAQVHLKVGYSPGYFQPEENNKLLNAYNDSNPWLKTKFDDVNWMHGLDVGARYRLGFVAVEAGWTASFTKAEAEGTEPISDNNLLNKLIYRYNKYSIGLENYIGRFGFGASFNYNRLRMIAKDDDDRTDLLSTNQWTGTLFVGFYTEHYNGISFGLRPYVQLPLSQFDITPLADHLGEPATEPILEKEYMVFGISLVIFNGF